MLSWSVVFCSLYHILSVEHVAAAPGENTKGKDSLPLSEGQQLSGPTVEGVG